MSRSKKRAESWKVWDLGCSKCGKCVTSCPTYIASRWEHLSPKGRIMLIPHIEDDSELLKSIFTCFTCGICENICPSGLEITSIIERGRKRFSEKGILPEKHERLLTRMETFGNPYGIQLERFEPKGDVEVIYYPGCTTIAKEEEILRSAISVLERSGVSFGVEFNYCCGSTALRIGGDEKYAKRNYERLVEAVEKTNAERVITSCPGCYRTIKKDYEIFGGLNAEVQHLVEFLAERIDSIKLRREEKRIVFHDSCHLGRHMGIYEEPRKILSKIGIVVEPEKAREESFCCGGGGGVKLSYKDVSSNVKSIRLKMLKDTGAEIIVTSCPYCYRNLKNSDESIKIKDITMIIEERLEQ